MQEDSLREFLTKKETRHVCLVQGPPGCGKKTLIRNVVQRFQTIYYLDSLNFLDGPAKIFFIFDLSLNLIENQRISLESLIKKATRNKKKLIVTTCRPVKGLNRYNCRFIWMRKPYTKEIRHALRNDGKKTGYVAQKLVDSCGLDFNQVQIMKKFGWNSRDSEVSEKNIVQQILDGSFQEDSCMTVSPNLLDIVKENIYLSVDDSSMNSMVHLDKMLSELSDLDTKRPPKSLLDRKDACMLLARLARQYIPYFSRCTKCGGKLVKITAKTKKQYIKCSGKCQDLMGELTTKVRTRMERNRENIKRRRQAEESIQPIRLNHNFAITTYVMPISKRTRLRERKPYDHSMKFSEEVLVERGRYVVKNRFP